MFITIARLAILGVSMTIAAVMLPVWTMQAAVDDRKTKHQGAGEDV